MGALIKILEVEFQTKNFEIKMESFDMARIEIRMKHFEIQITKLSEFKRKALTFK